MKKLNELIEKQRIVDEMCRANGLKIFGGRRFEDVLRVLAEMGAPAPRGICAPWVTWDNGTLCVRDRDLWVKHHGIDGPHSDEGDGVTAPVCSCLPDAMAVGPAEELAAIEGLIKQLRRA